MNLLGWPWWAWLLVAAGLAAFVPLKIVLTRKFLARREGGKEPELDD